MSLHDDQDLTQRIKGQLVAFDPTLDDLRQILAAFDAAAASGDQVKRLHAGENLANALSDYIDGLTGTAA